MTGRSRRKNGRDATLVLIFATSQSGGVAIALNKVVKAFANGRVVLREFSLDIEAREFLAILGPSGCGKSTLLRLIAGLLQPDSGVITIQPSGAFQTGYVFQDAHLLPWRQVADNVALPLELLGVPRRERNAKALDALARVNLPDASALYPAELSGGMKMRVSIARALVTRPKLLLLDEPFAALDEITRFQLEVSLRSLWQEQHMTVVFVTHSMSEAAFLSNRAIVLTRREGNIKLDCRTPLPSHRGAELRTDPALAHVTKALLNAMEEE